MCYPPDINMYRYTHRETSRHTHTHALSHPVLHFPLLFLPQGIWSPPDVKLRNRNAIDSQLIFPKWGRHSPNFIFFGGHTAEGRGGWQRDIERESQGDECGGRWINGYIHRDIYPCHSSLFQAELTSGCHSRKVRVCERNKARDRCWRLWSGGNQ